MNLRDKEEFYFCWKVVDNHRRKGDRHHVLIKPDPEGYIQSDRFDVTAIAIERE